MTASPRVAWILAAVVGIAAVPFVLEVYPVTLVIEVMIFGLFALGINMLLGYTGYISVGHSMFLGLGGYGIAVCTLLLDMPVWLGMIIAMAVTAAVSLILGAICMRISRIQFLVITLALSQLLYGVAVKTRVTGGDDGMAGVPRPDLSWLGLDTFDTTVFYYYVAVSFLVLLWIIYRIVRSPFGSVLVGIRENEKRMTALGYRVARYKNAGFVLSGVIAGYAGMLLAQYQEFVNPDTMTWEISGEGLLMVIIGGRQYFLGPVLGAAFFIIMKAQLSEITEEYIIFFGLFFMVIVALFGRGLAGFGHDLYRRWRTVRQVS